MDHNKKMGKAQEMRKVFPETFCPTMRGDVVANRGKTNGHVQAHAV